MDQEGQREGSPADCLYPPGTADQSSAISSLVSTRSLQRQTH